MLVSGVQHKHLIFVYIANYCHNKCSFFLKGKRMGTPIPNEGGKDSKITACQKLQDLVKGG